MRLGHTRLNAKVCPSPSLTGGDRDGNTVHSRSSSTGRIAALLETGARQEPARPLDGYGHFAASSELCGKRAKRSQPEFSFQCFRCIEYSAPRAERSVAGVRIRSSVQRTKYGCRADGD